MCFPLPPLRLPPGPPIRITCPACQRPLRLDARAVGRAVRCPACRHVIPPALTADPPEPEDRRTYSLRVDPTPAPGKQPTATPVPAAHPAASSLRRLPDPPPPTGPDRPGTPAIDPRVAAFAKARAQADDARTVSVWSREIVSVFGLSLTPARLLLTALVCAAVGGWYFTGPHRDAHVGTPQPVFLVDVLPSVQRLSPAGPPAVGGPDRLFVTQPHPGGDYLLLRVRLKQGALNTLGQTSGFHTTIPAHAFQLTPGHAPGNKLGSGNTPAPASAAAPGNPSTAPGNASVPPAPRLIVESFDQPIDLQLAAAPTTQYRALLPPDPPSTPDRLDVETRRGLVTGQAEYALGRTRGTVDFTASAAYQSQPAAQGLSATGTLITQHPDPMGPQVTALYQGPTLRVSWPGDARAHWAAPRVVETSRTWPWSRYELSLLFPRPPAGRYRLTFAGRGLATVRVKTPSTRSAPAPSPIASQRPGGPQPASKNSGSPLAYFDVLRDARSRAQGIVSASNMRQIGIALMQYRDDHRGAFPENLLQLRPYLDGFDQIMTNPRTGDRPGFIYQPPSHAAGASPANTPILYESYQGQRDLNGAVLYGDGSIR
ncbi:MAG: hypothetical protein AAGG38_13280 [Planctomycetota bacterium]